jgi:cytochrome c556
MKSLIYVLCLTLAAAGLVYADHAYEEVASVHDIMEVIQKPSMDAVVAIAKAGGPQSDKDWKAVKMHASILAESTQLTLMGSRVKDEAWTKGANEVIAAAKGAMTAADAKDMDGFKAASGGLGRGCRTCHNVHKPKTPQ